MERSVLFANRQNDNRPHKSEHRLLSFIPPWVSCHYQYANAMKTTSLNVTAWTGNWTFILTFLINILTGGLDTYICYLTTQIPVPLEWLPGFPNDRKPRCHLCRYTQEGRHQDWICLLRNIRHLHHHHCPLHTIGDTKEASAWDKPLSCDCWVLGRGIVKSHCRRLLLVPHIGSHPCLSVNGSHLQWVPSEAHKPN